jgi:hypothetical protein
LIDVIQKGWIILSRHNRCSETKVKQAVVVHLM